MKSKQKFFGTKQKVGLFGDINIQLHGKQVERVPKFNYSGVILDEQISWKEHTEEVSKKVSKRFGLPDVPKKVLRFDPK